MRGRVFVFGILYAVSDVAILQVCIGVEALDEFIVQLSVDAVFVFFGLVSIVFVIGIVGNSGINHADNGSEMASVIMVYGSTERCFKSVVLVIQGIYATKEVISQVLSTDKI